MQNGGPRGWNSKKIALAGVFSALAVVFLLAGQLFPFATFMAPALAGLCFIPVAAEMGAKTAWLAWAAVSLLAFLVVPDRESSLFFTMLLGYYPILQPGFEKIQLKALRWALKFLLFNAAVLIIYALLFWLFTAPGMVEEITSSEPWFLALLLIVGNITFFLYDILIDKVRFIYNARFRRRFFH